MIYMRVFRIHLRKGFYIEARLKNPGGELILETVRVYLNFTFLIFYSFVPIGFSFEFYSKHAHKLLGKVVS
jgi:hypothetical protein